MYHIAWRYVRTVRTVRISPFSAYIQTVRLWEEVARYNGSRNTSSESFIDFTVPRSGMYVLQKAHTSTNDGLPQAVPIAVFTQNREPQRPRSHPPAQHPTCAPGTAAEARPREGTSYDDDPRSTQRTAEIIPKNRLAPACRLHGTSSR